MFNNMIAGLVHSKEMNPSEFRDNLLKACEELGKRCDERVPGTRVVLTRDELDAGAALIVITAPGQMPQKFQVKYNPNTGLTSTLSVYEVPNV